MLRAELLPWFDAWKTCAETVISQTSGQPQAFELSPEPFDATDSDLRYTIVAAGAVQGEMALRLHPASGFWLARKFLGEPAMPVARPAASGSRTDPAATDAVATDAAPASGAATSASEISNDDSGALEELLRQIAGLAATALAAVTGAEVKLQLSLAEAPWAWSADAIASLRTANEADAEIAIEMGVSPALAVAFTAVIAARNAPPTAPRTASAPEPAAFETVSLPANAAGYHRLFEVGLGVKLRFGTRRMRLRDVLALSSGLVVELENALNSPVDLLLDGRIIARGEVVVIDGKYGLRVTDVVDSPAAGQARPA